MNVQTDPARLIFSDISFPAPAERPIRSNFIREDNLRHLGREFALNSRNFLRDLEPFDLHQRLKDNAERILAVYRATNEAVARGDTITPAAQWLLDNNYVVEESLHQVKRDLPLRYYRELPLIEIGSGQKIPRVLALAWLYVAHSDSAVSETAFQALVQGFQTEQSLKIGELWALPSILRFVLTDNLRRIAVRVNRAREMRAIANLVADRILGSGSTEAGIQALEALNDHARDKTFATQLLYRLRDGSRAAVEALRWLETELERSGRSGDEIIADEHQTLSAGNVTTGNIIRGLRLVNDIEWAEWFEALSHVDRELRKTAHFTDLDFASRDEYRTAVERLAKRSKREEVVVAQMAIARAAECGDVGHVLVGSERVAFERSIDYRPTLAEKWRRLFKRVGWLGIFVPVLLLTALLLTGAGLALWGLGFETPIIAVLLALFAFPACEGAIGLFNTLTLLFLQPTRLIGFEYKDGIPGDARTLLVVPSLIGSRDDVDESIRNLEVHFLANMKGELFFALLSDWNDSRVEVSPQDTDLLDYARAQLRELNMRYPREGSARFHLLHRRRLWNPSEGVWMGWERKRGKLHELNLLLRGDNDTTFMAPETPLPAGVVYVMTLDSDTRTTREAVTRLVGKMQHPLNRPVNDPETGVVTRGTAILQPRVTPSLTTGDEASFFQRVFSANRGLDPYVFAVSDLYQDVFASGTFTGKGLYHVDAFEAALRGRIKENTVLSHDLLEGSLAAAQLATDVELIEDYPTRYTTDASRQHRWARGDWQLLPYLFDPASGIPALSRWKMVDNLRRSLTPVFWVLASIAGWTLLPFTYAVQWQALLIVSVFLAQTFEIVDSIVPRNGDITIGGHLGSFARDFAFATAHVVLKVVLMAHSAWLMFDAIARTLYRTFVSRRHMLEWRTASQANKSGANNILGYYRAMHGALVIAVIGVAIPTAADSTGAFLGALFALFWMGSPAFAWLISRSAQTEDRLKVTEADRAALRVVARRTWLYFETFVTAGDHHLPPDNFQENPADVVAHRTSPTNIGVYLLSVVSARDFGWISLDGAGERLDQTLATVEKMERFRGHLYNWYDTQTLQPLLPLYVSAVDSGNLAGHLIAVARACAEWSEAPAAHLQGDFNGVMDVVSILDDTLAHLPDDRRQLRPLRQRLADRVAGMRRAVATLQSEPDTALIRTINLTVLASEIRKLASSIHAETKSAASENLQLWATKLAQTCEAHVADAHTDEAAVEAFRHRFRALHDRARTLAFEMEFAFLFRGERKLLSIGYRADTHQLDESCYDLLASEARLTSLFAIAKGDLPTEHWFRLGRPVTEIGYRGALMSWSGSMFEYLMPPLVMKEPQGGLLNQTSTLIIRRQISYGRSKNIPWGISEAAFNARDREMTYQYTNFGVPGLGLKRGLANNTVIAPYATVLAAQFLPEASVRNLQRLARIGGLGRYGYYDAVDFTPSRVPEGADHAVVQNYMAHHQGMSVVAIANVVFEGRMRERFHSDPVIEAAELLLQEKAPRAVPMMPVRTEAAEKPATGGEELSPDTREIENPLGGVVATNLISNGHYTVMTTATGTGYSRFNDLAVTRWSADGSEDRSGSFLFVRDVDTGEWWSATAEPKRAPDEEVRVYFADAKGVFTKKVGSLLTEVEVIAVSEGDGEARRITIYNEGQSERTIEITSYGEIVLAPEASDNAHPAFSKMFIETEIDDESGAIFATRRKRSDSDPVLALAHFVTTTSGGARETEAETDRRAFIGRGRTIADPIAFSTKGRLSGSDGFTLDPIMALRSRVRVPAMRKAALTFWTIVGPDRNTVSEAMLQLDHPESFNRQAMLNWTHSQVQTRHIGLSLAEAANAQRLARYLLFSAPVTRTPPEAIAEGMGSQSSLWSLSISGDYPILAIRISDQADLHIVAKAMRVHEYLRVRGLTVDLVIINEQASSYVQDLQNAIDWHCERGRTRGHEIGPRQHIFSVRRDLMEASTYRTLMATARVVFHAHNGTITDQIERAEIAELERMHPEAAGKALSPSPLHRTASKRHEASRSRDVPVHRSPNMEPQRANGSGLRDWNGFGGFDRDGRDYVVRLDGERSTPHPWINVIANPEFGFHVSAEGAAFTWSRNSRDYQLTPWSNDPVSNRPGEAIYIHDLAEGTTFSPVAAVVRNPQAVYEARHGQGFTTFRSTHGALETELTHVVDPADPVRLSRLTLHNRGSGTARLRVYAYAEWVLGQNRARSGPNIVCWQDDHSRALLARNPFSLDFGERCAFLASNEVPQFVSVDRAEFLGRSGSVWSPEAVVTGSVLSGKVEAGVDPCATLAHDLTIKPGQSATLIYLIGDAADPDEARHLYQRHLETDFNARLDAIDAEWQRFLGTLQVKTPDPALDAMVNAWLPYQALACRIRARSAFYQSSGAYGFRDQLQDTLALMLHEPSLARTQILNAAGRQFAEGDVQHWWLPRSGAGVRTTISDDVVWLAFGTHSYVRTTGDACILDEELPFITGQALQPGEHDAFFTPAPSSDTATLFEHCARGLDLAVQRTGADGLPLILGGDWNDGMNSVGRNGAGQSVWLGWFLARALADFIPLADSRGEGERARRWEAHVEHLKAALEEAGWDGEWYRRGTYDDGSPLGSKLSDECQIDSIAQSWSVLSELGEPDRQAIAMRSVQEQLIDEDLKILRLFTPPFSQTPKEPGYIKSYPPGVRENGGQYTHAATWAVLALAKLGEADAAYRALSMLLPANHAHSAEEAERYRVEPYVVAADIYGSTGSLAGRGGWTWYTGSAGWLYRAAVEGLLGIRREGDRLHIVPVLPSHWPGFQATLRMGEATYKISVQRGEKRRISLNGALLNDPFMPHSGAGSHEVEVTIPRSLP